MSDAPSPRRVVLVCGPPCAGKSSYVEEHAGPGDVVVDYDQIAADLGSSGWDHPADVRSQVRAQRAEAEALVASMASGTAWVIRSAADAGKREALAEALGADDVVVLDVPPDEAKRRAEADGRPPWTAQAIDRWWSRYEQSARPGGGLSDSQPLEGHVMPEETEQQVESEVVESTEVEPAGVETESTESVDDGQQTEDRPFDRKQAEAKIRKANSEAANLRKRLKEIEPLAVELQRIKDAEKTESERLNDQLAAANDRIAKTRQRLVRSEVQAAAASSFADPEDAVGALDLSAYIDSDGEIDGAAIEADLQALLERKPHWAKAQPPEGPRRPAPDRTQASGANQSRSAQTPADAFAAFIMPKLK